MRLRRNWKGEAELPSMPGVLDLASTSFQQNWDELFGRKASLHVEIGAGKGEHIMEAARTNPGINYVGIERVPTVLYMAVKKSQDLALANLRFVLLDADAMASYFPAGSIERIYLNFSDPWPKNRHRERRLTAKDKLAIYQTLLIPGGEIHLKTDQEAFFYFSLGEFIHQGWSVGKLCTDLYRSTFEANISTEYETRFVAMGKAIYRMEAWRKR